MSRSIVRSVKPAAILFAALFTPVSGRADVPAVTAVESAGAITLDNGVVALDIGRAKAQIVSIRYRQGERVTEVSRTMYASASAGPTDRGAPRPPAGSIQIAPNRPPRIAHSDAGGAEVIAENGPTPTFPFHTETHYYLPRGESGFYVWQLYTHTAEMPAATIGEARFVIKGPPGPSLFTNHVVDAKRMGAVDTSPIVKQVSDATFLLHDGTIYTKYDNSAVLADHYVHGMTGHGLGIWMINPSNEYINGGPVKQELTVHADNTLLNMLQGAHFGSGVLNILPGEPWRKLYGPFFVYLNGAPSTEAMFRDATARAERERMKWPYRWAANEDYPVERGVVRGTLNFTDGAVPEGAWVGLAAPGGDWPLQGKSYQFWSRVGRNGVFTIPKVRPGSYSLYAWGAGEFEQFAHDGLEVSANRVTDLGALRWQRMRHGRTIWQIGIADRTTQEFYDGQNVRHFANYLRYPKAFPEDVSFEVGKSREATDWNFAQWTWYCRKPYWTIRFDRPSSSSGVATLTLGIAASNPARGGSSSLHIKVNGQEVGALHLAKSGPAAYRSGGMDSLYRVESVRFDASLLKAGRNEITLAHGDAEPLPSPEVQAQGRVGAIMYDAIRLEIDEKSQTPDASNRRLPALYIIGDSTVKNGTRGQMGWGDPLATWFDPKRISVFNRARGGRSSRTYRTEGLWQKVVSELRPGDFVLMQFGHNDGGSLAGSPRASLKGGGEETQEVRDEKTGAVEVVHTFGWYLRRYAAEAKMKGATPIICSLIPRNIWRADHTIARSSADYGNWAREAAEAEKAPFIDLNERIARKYDDIGELKVKESYFPADHTHTNPAGAALNAVTVVEALRELRACPLAAYLLDKPPAAGNRADSP